MSFAQIELEVVRKAEEAGVVSKRSLKAQWRNMQHDHGAIGDAIDTKDMDSLKKSIGWLANDLVVLCALADINLTDCMKQANG
jgi:hypothetical protein